MESDFLPRNSSRSCFAKTIRPQRDFCMCVAIGAARAGDGDRDAAGWRGWGARGNEIDFFFFFFFYLEGQLLQKC